MGEDEGDDEDDEGIPSSSACEEGTPGLSGERTPPRTRASARKRPQPCPAAGVKRIRTAQARPCLRLSSFAVSVLRLSSHLRVSERSSRTHLPDVVGGFRTSKTDRLSLALCNHLAAALVLPFLSMSMPAAVVTHERVPAEALRASSRPGAHPRGGPWRRRDAGAPTRL